MIELSASEVAFLVEGSVTGIEDPNVTTLDAVVTDSRQVTPGSLFVAIRGENSDGHDHAEAAIAGGAHAVLAERELCGSDGTPLPCIVVPDSTRALGDLARGYLTRLRDTGDITVVGITGSVGKTTTKDLAAQVLAANGPVVAPVRSFNNEIGLPMTVLRADATTTTLVLEMGADAPGNIAYLTSIAPLDIACVLVVGNAHLGGMGGIDGVAQEKGTILDGVVAGGWSVLNGDDPRVAAMSTGRSHVLSYGTSAAADVRAERVRAEGARVSFDLVVGQQRSEVSLRLVGEHHLTNALATAAIAHATGMAVGDIARELSRAEILSPHRMATTELANGITLIDDSYNANPDSMRAALKALKSIGSTRRRVAVLGEMRELGEDALAAHDMIGRLAVRLDVSKLVVVGAGARAMYTGALLEGSFDSEAIYLDDLDAALAWWRENRARGDVILVKSSNGAGLWQFADALIAEDDS